MPIAELAWIEADGRMAHGNQALQVQGRKLTAPEDTLTAPEGCLAPSCARTAFQIGASAEAPNLRLEVVATWDFHEDAELSMRLLRADTTVVGSGQSPPGNSEFRIMAERSITYASVLHVQRPAPGAYLVEVRAHYGSAPYVVTLQWEAIDLATPGAGELLPNLVMLPPADLRIQAPSDTASQLATASGASRGCNLEETVEQGARRCLRFSSAYANHGLGPLELVLPLSEFPDAVQGSAEVTQRVYRADGSVRTHAAGRGEFHAAHHHFHLSEVLRNRLYAYDENTRTRLDPVVDAKKIGFCFIDVGVHGPMDAALPQAPTYGPMGCFSPHERSALVLGISPGWYDLYWWSLSDQYIDLGNLRDGTYELVSHVNPAGTLLESSVQDNEAGLAFRLEGDRITVLHSTGGRDA